MIDWNVRFGDLLVVASLAGTGIVYAFKSGRFAESIANMQKEIVALKESLKIVADVLTMVAVQKNEIKNIDRRLEILDDRVNDLKGISDKRIVDGEYK
jgi:hypothetical protein